jgi:DNA-binding beta-propeller fold protein YncE
MPWGASTSSVAVDGQGRVIALVRAVPYFRMFNADGSFVRAWGEAGLFHLAHSVHVAPDGTIWATDPDDHVVHKFGADGKVVMTLGKKGISGDDASRDAFNQPNSVGFAPNGDVFVSDGYVNSRVVQFSADGRLVRIWQERGRPRRAEHAARCRHRRAGAGDRPTAATISDWRFGPRIVCEEPCRAQPRRPCRGAGRHAYVSDVNAGAVTVLKQDQIVDVIKVDGRPHGLAVDVRTGDVYTSSTLADRWNVSKTTEEGAQARWEASKTRNQRVKVQGLKPNEEPASTGRLRSTWTKRSAQLPLGRAPQ